MAKQRRAFLTFLVSLENENFRTNLCGIFELAICFTLCRALPAKAEKDGSLMKTHGVGGVYDNLHASLLKIGGLGKNQVTVLYSAIRCWSPWTETNI